MTLGQSMRAAQAHNKIKEEKEKSAYAKQILESPNLALKFIHFYISVYCPFFLALTIIALFATELTFIQGNRDSR